MFVHTRQWQHSPPNLKLASLNTCQTIGPGELLLWVIFHKFVLCLLLIYLNDRAMRCIELRQLMRATRHHFFNVSWSWWHPCSQTKDVAYNGHIVDTWESGGGWSISKPPKNPNVLHFFSSHDAIFGSPNKNPISAIGKAFYSFKLMGDVAQSGFFIITQSNEMIATFFEAVVLI